MKNTLLTISAFTLLLAGQSAIAGESHENDRAIDAFISAQHETSLSNERVANNITNYSTAGHSADKAIDAFISAQHDARQNNGNVTMQKVSFVTNEVSESASYKMNNNLFSLDYSNDK